MESCTRLVARVISNEIKKGSNNVVTSPSSLNLLLNMAASGSKGKTLDQFLRFLGSKSLGDLTTKSCSLISLIDSSANDTTSVPKLGRPILSMANLLLFDQRVVVKPSYQKLIQDIYKTEPEGVDYQQQDQLRNKVNSWAAKNTNGLINQVLPPTQLLEPPLLLANAVYFKAAWANNFEKSSTQDRDFHLLDGNAIGAPFMAAYNRKSYYGSYRDFKVVRLDCEDSGDKDFYMDIILPNRTDGLQDMIERFKSEPELLLGRFNVHPTTINKMLIPKWKISYQFEPHKMLKEMGLNLPFFPLNGDFTEMVEEGPPDTKLIYIKKIIQKARVTVDEEGTEAAAVTCALTRMGCARRSPPPKLNFVADHPFMFMIKEGQSGAVLFAGVVLNPLSDS